MKTLKRVLCSLSFLGFLTCAAASAQVRAYVASTGQDTNACSVTAPCKTFQAAVNAVQPGGEVVALDSAEYGPITILKGVSVTAAPGIEATVTAQPLGLGIGINVPAQASVTLRGLTITGGPKAIAGVFYSTGQALHIENCVVSGFKAVAPPSGPHSGVLFQGAGNFEMKDSTVRGNDDGVVVATLNGTALAVIDHVRFESNGIGLLADIGAKVTVRNSVAAANEDGFSAQSESTPVELTVDNCMVANNSGNGIVATGSSTTIVVRVSNSTVTDNSTGLSTQGGALLLSRDNNTVGGNGTDLVGVIGSYSAK